MCIVVPVAAHGHAGLEGFEEFDQHEADIKFPDIPNVDSTKTARPLPNSVNIPHTDPVSWVVYMY